MLVGTTMYKMDGNPFYSPEFPRGGLAATYSADVTNLAGSPQVTITVQHRNAEDTTFSDLGTFSTISTIDTHTKDLAGIKEIVRFKYNFDAGDAASDGIHFLMQAPSWRPY